MESRMGDNHLNCNQFKLSNFPICFENCQIDNLTSNMCNTEDYSEVPHKKIKLSPEQPENYNIYDIIDKELRNNLNTKAKINLQETNSNGSCSTKQNSFEEEIQQNIIINDESVINSKNHSAISSKDNEFKSQFENLELKQTNSLESKRQFNPIINKCRHRYSIDIIQSKSLFDQSNEGSNLNDTNNSPNKSNYRTPQFKPKIHEEIVEEHEFSLTSKGSNLSSTKKKLASPKKEIFSETQNKNVECLLNLLKLTKQSIKKIPANLEEDTSICLKCKMKHSYDTTLSNLKKNLYDNCTKCQACLKKCKDYAQSFGGMVLNQVFDSEIIYKCAKNHIWTVKYQSWNKKWCSKCEQEQKEIFKKQLEEEEKIRYEQNCMKQEKLFQEAKSNYLREKMLKQNSTNFTNNRNKGKIEDSFKKISMEISKLAEKQAQEEIKQNLIVEKHLNVTYQEMISVYKVLLLPQNILKFYLQSLDKKRLRREYFQLAKEIHPDKNSHPHAATAFQRLHNIYQNSLLLL